MGCSHVPSCVMSRERRLRQGRDFARVKARGRRVVSNCLIANWVVLPKGTVTRMGVVTGRKLGNAVVRSRARRLLRESFRIHQHELRQPLDLVLVARPSIVGKRFVEVEAALLSALLHGGLLQRAAARQSPAAA